jgi:thiamine pyrophosphate-dependent acetolactate synthase large subunit-like protein
MVAQFQESNMNGRYIATRDGYSTPDFCEVASAYGIEAHSISTVKEMELLTELAANQSSNPMDV